MSHWFEGIHFREIVRLNLRWDWDKVIEKMFWNMEVVKSKSNGMTGEYKPEDESEESDCEAGLELEENRYVLSDFKMTWWFNSVLEPHKKSLMKRLPPSKEKLKCPLKIWKNFIQKLNNRWVYLGWV